MRFDRYNGRGRREVGRLRSTQVGGICWNCRTRNVFYAAKIAVLKFLVPLASYDDFGELVAGLGATRDGQLVRNSTWPRKAQA